MRNPKHIVITGASSGIGAALAETYAAEGVRLSLHGRDSDRLAAVAAKASSRGATVTIMRGSVTEAEAMTTWLMVCDQIQPIDLVIANAGISAGTGGRHESEEQIRAIFAANLTGVLNTIQPVIPLMTERRKGQIAIMSSLAGFRGLPGAPAYCASKAAVRIYGEALRGDLAAYDVEVNVICPGFVKTPMTDVNRFYMPFILPVERAGAIIKRGLESNKARIAFPWRMYAIVRLLAALPQAWSLDSFSRFFPRKPAL